MVRDITVITEIISNFWLVDIIRYYAKIIMWFLEYISENFVIWKSFEYEEVLNFIGISDIRKQHWCLPSLKSLYIFLVS